jgi:hypothetical protein
MKDPVSAISNRYRRDTVNDLAAYSIATELQLVVFAVFFVFVLTLPYLRRLWCSAAQLPDTPRRDEQYNGTVTVQWRDNEMPFFVNELNRQLNTTYTVLDTSFSADNPRCQIYRKLLDLMPNQLIAVANEYKNKKCKTIRQHIGETRFSGCSVVNTAFGTNAEEALINKLNYLNIT